MLAELHIEDLGVIDRLDLVIGAGLVVVTGETGAGKTMIVEALELLVGGRADTGCVRPGASEARVEGRFVSGDDEWVLARVIPTDGRSRAYVNGRLATVAQLAEIGTQLVDIHGQHAHQGLLTTAVQRAALDTFAGTDLAPLREARARLTEIDAAMASLGGDQRARAREIDLLRFQVQEIDGVAIASPDEDGECEREEDVLADASAHREAAELAHDQLTGDGAAIDRVASALGALGSRSPFAELAARLRGASAELADIAHDIRSIGEECLDDPERLAQLRQRRQVLRDLRRKYGETLADVIAYGHESRARLAELESYETRVAELASDRQRAEKTERSAAKKVAATRRAAASRLAEAVTAHLAELALPKASIAVDVRGDDPGDEVVFEFVANPGLPPGPLAKIASGGELARVMLALRLVLTAGPPVLVFDEVDAGIGGRAAAAVAEALARLGRSHQVLVVTHLAQVAALADRHVVIEKDFVSRRGAESTVARARLVDGSERVDEVARMLSGQPDSAAARRHAQELLTAAKKSRSS